MFSFPLSQDLSTRIFLRLFLVCFFLQLGFLFVPGSLIASTDFVGICQSKDKLALELNEKKDAQTKEKQVEWDKEREKVKGALKAREDAKNDAERDKIEIPDGPNTLLFRIEQAREKIENDYFEAKSEKKALLSMRFKMEESLRQAKLSVNLTFDSMGDLLTTFEPSRLSRLGLPIYKSPSDVSEQELENINESFLIERKDLLKEKSAKESNYEALKALHDPSFNYISARAGLYGAPDFNGGLKKLSDEGARQKALYDSALDGGQQLKARYLTSKAAVEASTSPTTSEIGALKNLGDSLKEAASSLGKLHYSWKLKEKEHFELSKREKTWMSEKEITVLKLEEEKLSTKINEMKALRILVRSFNDIDTEYRDYKADVAAIESKLKELEPKIEAGRKKEQLLEEKLKRFVDSEIREKERIKQAEAAANSGYLKMLTDWVGKKIDWLCATIMEIPQVMMAVAFLKFASPGYCMEIVKEFIMLTVGVVSDYVFASVPLVGMAVGFAINQIDAQFSNPVQGKVPENPAIVLTVSPNASRYYFLSSDGKGGAANEMINLLSSYDEFLAQISKGHSEALDKEEKRAEDLVRLSNIYDDKLKLLNQIIESIRIGRKDMALKEDEITGAEKILAPVRAESEKTIIARSSLYTLLKDVEQASSEEELALLEEQIGKEQEVLNQSLRKLNSLVNDSAIIKATEVKASANSKIEVLKKQINTSSVELFDIEMALFELSEEIEFIAGSTKSPFKVSKDAFSMGGVTLKRPLSSVASQTGESAGSSKSPKTPDNSPAIKAPRLYKEGSIQDLMVQQAKDIPGWYTGEIRKIAVTSLLTPFLPGATSDETTAKLLLPMKDKVKLMVNTFLEKAGEEINGKIMPLLSAPLMVAGSTSSGIFTDRAIYVGELFAQNSDKFKTIATDVAFSVSEMIKEDVRGKLQATREVLGSLKTTLKEIDLESLIMKKMGGLKGNSKSIEDGLKKLKALMAKADELSAKLSEKTAAFFKSFSGKSLLAGGKNSGQGKAAVAELMERVMKSSLASAIGDGVSGAGKILSSFNVSFVKCIKKSLTKGAGATVKVGSLLSEMFNGPANLVRTMAEKELKPLNGFVAATQKNMVGLYVNVLYTMSSLYSMIDVEDPCFPTQPLLQLDSETGKPLPAPVEIFVPQGDTYEGWIEAHDVTSGLNPQSFTLYVKDVTKGSVGAYAIEQDLFKKGGKAWTTLGENPLDEKRRGKGLKVLKETAFPHMQLGLLDPVSFMMNMILGKVGGGSYKMAAGEALYKENRIERARFNFSLDLKDAIGNTIKLSPKVFDRAGRPSSILAPNYFVKFIRDENHPFMMVQAPNLKGDNLYKSGDRVKVSFSIDDVSGKNTTKADSQSVGISGVSLGDISLSFLRHGKTFLRRQMTEKNITKGKLWKGINREELSASARTGSLSSKGSLVKDPVVFELSENLPEGEYELRIEARDRAGNKTVNGTPIKSNDKAKASAGGISEEDVPSIIVIVGTPDDVVIIPSLDPHVDIFTPGSSALVSLNISSRIPDSTIERIDLKIGANAAGKAQTDPGKGEKVKKDEKGKEVSSYSSILEEEPLAKLKAGLTIGADLIGKSSSRSLLIPDVFTLAVKKADFRQGALLEFPVSARVKVSGRESLIEADFTILVEVKGRLAPSDVFFESNIKFEDSKGSSHPLPFGTKVSIAQIYKMPLAGLGAAGLKAGGSKYVEQYVGYGEIDNSAGHLLCRVRPVGGREPTKFRVVADSFAVEPLAGGGKRGIASVVGTMKKVPFKIVGLPFNPASEILAQGSSKVTFLRYGGGIVIPGHKSEKHPVLLKYEGELTTGGHINPWGDMGQGGAGAFAMSMTLAGQMAEVSKLGNESGPDSTIPGLLYRNHTDAFMALSAMVKAYQFSKGCSKISAPSSLRFEFGTGFIPLLPSSSQSLIDAYGGDSSSDVDPATDTGSDSDSGSGVNKVADNMLKHLQSLRTNLNDDAKLVAMTDELIRLSEGLFSSMAVIDEAERELALARGRKERAALRKTEIPGKKTWIKATIMVLRERQLAFGNEPSVNGDLDSEIATFEAILKALEAEEEWLLEKEKSFSDELEALNKRLKANQEAFSAMRKDFLSEKQNLAAFSGEAGVSSDILNIPGPFERFDSFSSYVPEEEKDNIKRQLEIEVYLAEMKKERVRRELKKEPLELKGQMARWWPSARDDNTGGTVLYKIDYEKNKRIMIPDGKGGNAEDMYRVARAYGSYIRQTNIARELAKVPSYDYSGPVGILDKTNAVRQAWDEGFDTFFASAIMGTPFFFDGVDSKKVDYQETISSLGKWDSKLKNRYKLRGLDNPKAVATAFWLLYERFGKDFLANILGYGERLHFPKLVQWYPELTEEFMSLGLLPVLSFSSGKNGLPVISWDDNGIVRDCRDLSFIVEYSRSSAFSDDVHTIVGNASKVIDFGKALDPEDSNFVLGNVLEDGNWYFRARLENGWAKEIFGEAATGTSVFTVSRPSVKIGPSGGQVPFESGSVKGRIDVDAGALPSDTNISATSLSIPGDIEGYHVVGSTAFEFLPEVSYQKVAKFTFEYSDEDVSGVNEKDIGLYKYNKETGKFAAVKHTRDEKTNQITAYRSGHSVYALLVDTQPPAMESVRDGKDPFNPEAGVISIEVAASEAADFTISIKDSSGKAVREFESEVFDSGKGKVFWDGRNEEGLIALDGQYTYTVFATDLTGKKSIPLSGRMWVLRGGGNTVSGKVSLKDGSNPSSVEVFIDEMTLQAPVDRNGNFSLSGVPFGNHSFTATLDGWFPARWENVMVKSEQDTVLTSAVISNTILSTFKMVSKTVSPDGDGINDVFVARYETTQDVPVTVEIYNDQNRLINTPLSGKLNKQGPHTLVWDCLTEEGVVSGGLHYLKFYGHSGNQKLLQKETTFIVDTGLACALYTDPVQFSPNGDGLDDLTSVMFKVTSTATVTVEIVDSMKSPVATLIDKKEYTEGYVNISWDGTSDHGDMLPDGRYTAVLRSFYPDGTPSISFEKLLVLDSIVPSIGNVTPVNGSILTTGMPLVTARVVASPGDVPSGYVKVKIDEVTSEPDSYDPQTGVVKFRPATSLGEGIHVCIFYARDIAGNEAPPAAVSFNVDLKGSPDSTRPLITPVSPLYDEVVYTRNPSFDFTIFDERSGVDSNTVSLHIDDEPVANSVVEYIPGTSGKDWDMYYYEKMKVLYSSLSGKMRYNSLNELKAINNQIEGLHTYRVAVMDKSGNRSKELHGRFRLVLDEAEPTIVSLSQSPSAAREPSEFKKLIDDSIAAIGNENLNYKAKLTFDSRTPDFSFLVYDEGKAQIDSDALTRFENIFIAIDGKRVEGKINVQALAGKENRTLVSFCPKEELTTFEEHVITATVKDRAGNKSSVASRIFTIVLDEKPPVIVSVKPENNALCRVIPEVSVTFFDKGGAGVDLKGLSISLDGTRIGSEVLTLKEMGSLSAYGPSDADSLSGTEGSIKSSMRFADSSSKVLTAPISDGLSEGKHILSVKVKDRVGNESILHNSSFIYSLDMENPELVTFSPPHRSEIDGWTVRVSAKVKGKGTSLDPSAVVLTLDGKKIAVPEGAFDAYEGTLLINVPIEDKSRNVHILGFDVGDYGGNYLKEPHISVFTTSGQLSKKESLSKADDSLVQERGDGK